MRREAKRLYDYISALQVEQASTNVLHELDRITREIVQHTVKAQQTAAAGQPIAVPKARTPVSVAALGAELLPPDRLR